MSRMDNRSRRSRKKKSNRLILSIIIVLFMLVILGAAVLLAHSIASARDAKSDNNTKVKTSTKTEQTVTIGSAGDVIIHNPFLDSNVYKTSKGYDFTSCFKYVKELYNQEDYMVANLETTLSGKSVGYSGYPVFNSPDSLVDNMHNSGIDMFLLANNHIYDKGKNGFLRTSEVLQEKGYDYTGARHSDKGNKYKIVNVNGVKVGMINYTFQTPSQSGKAINGNKMDSSVASYLNSFNPNKLDDFYNELTKQVALMKLSGVEYIIFYPHWGEEYKTEAYGYTKKMAQKACDIGVDAIIGGHPHVVEPVDVLTSSDGKRKTFVAYSMGNLLSNQRRELISSLPTGNTEDGIMVNLQITRDKHGSVSLTGLDIIPTWVYKSGSSNAKYYVIPLNDLNNIEKKTGISGIASDCNASSKRTHKIVDSGLKKVKEAYGF